MITKELAANRKAVTTKTLALTTALVTAVALPQVLHLVGAFSGLGTGLGQTFLPMYLPILLVGLLAGVWPAVLAGALAPLISFALSGMPTSTMLPIISSELLMIGLAAGLLRSVQLPVIAKVLLVQLAGKAAYALAVLASVYILDGAAITLGIVLESMRVGLPGFILQWVLVPLIIFRVANRKASEGPSE